MALDYDDRIDFRAFDVLASAIENATAADLERAILSCSDIARNWTHGTTSHIRIKRLLFRGFANLMRLHVRRLNRPAPRQLTATDILSRQGL